MSFNVSVFNNKKQSDRRLFPGKHGIGFMNQIKEQYPEKVVSGIAETYDLDDGHYIAIDDVNVKSEPGEELPNYISFLFLHYDERLLKEVLEKAEKF